jgi:hypothetical protein
MGKGEENEPGLGWRLPPILLPSGGASRDEGRAAVPAPGRCCRLAPSPCRAAASASRRSRARPMPSSSAASSCHPRAGPPPPPHAIPASSYRHHPLASVVIRSPAPSWRRQGIGWVGTSRVSQGILFVSLGLGGRGYFGWRQVGTPATPCKWQGATPLISGPH